MTPNFMWQKERKSRHKQSPVVLLAWVVSAQWNEIIVKHSAFLRWQMIAGFEGYRVWCFLKTQQPLRDSQTTSSKNNNLFSRTRQKNDFFAKRSENEYFKDYFALYLFICQRQIHNSKKQASAREAPSLKYDFHIFRFVLLRAIGQ